jgi:hypothetical protein
MKKILKALIPPTEHIGSYTLAATEGFFYTAKQNILWDYNKAREREGLQPLKKMPRGTKYVIQPLFG